MKPFRLLCYMFLLSFFGPRPCITFNSIPIILNLLTIRNITFIQSQFVNKKSKDCAQSGSFQYKL